MKHQDPSPSRLGLTGGCRRISLPDPFPPGTVAVFVIRGSDGPWLLDAGPPGEAAAGALSEGLADLGLAKEDLRGVLLSHGHLDHIGGLAAWRPERIVAHADAARALARSRRSGTEAARDLLKRAGVSAERRERLEEFREPRDPALARELRIDSRLEGERGDLDPLPGWRWLRVGGHAPGHLLLHRPDDGTVLAFDQFMDRLKTPFDLEDPDGDPWGDYLRSLERTASLEPEVLHSAHTDPIRPALPWLERRRSTMEGQLDRIAASVEAGARTAVEAARRLYPDDLPPGRRILLLGEVLAGLRHLASEGRLRRRSQEGVELYGPE